MHHTRRPSGMLEYTICRPEDVTDDTERWMWRPGMSYVYHREHANAVGTRTAIHAPRTATATTMEALLAIELR